MLEGIDTCCKQGFSKSTFIHKTVDRQFRFNYTIFVRKFLKGRDVVCFYGRVVYSVPKENVWHIIIF